jgi:hypothetical protein
VVSDWSVIHMAEKYNLSELLKKIPYGTVAPILTAWDEQSDNDVTDLARMAYEAGRNSVSKEKNKMEQVAALFGKRLGEEFKIKDLMTEKIYVALFDNYGMKAYVEGFSNSWKPRRDMVMRLIVGEAVITDD